MPYPRRAGNDPFNSFWMAGFEGADHVNLAGLQLDMVHITGHAEQCADDYALAATMGMKTVRESVGWRVCAPVSWRSVDFSRLRSTARAAAQQDVQVLWTLMHYGTPPDVDITKPEFSDCFADFAGAAARELRAIHGTPSIYNPINEIGFLSWALEAKALVGGMPDGIDGHGIKCRLVHAALQATEAIRAADPGARFLHVEPLIHVVAPRAQPGLAQAAADYCTYQWQVWDMLLGRMSPELGGSPASTDWIGVNHYHDAQWEIGTGQRLDWALRDPRRRPFAALLQETWQRYQLPIVVAETSHVGDNRAAWLAEMAAQTLAARQQGVSVQGMCLYPAVDRPCWNNLSHWHRSGLWDNLQDDTASAPPAVPRRLAGAYARALGHWQQQLR